MTDLGLVRRAVPPGLGGFCFLFPGTDVPGFPIPRLRRWLFDNPQITGLRSGHALRRWFCPIQKNPTLTAKKRG